MRTTIAGLLWIVFTIFLAPIVLQRTMDEAPGWVWRAISMASIVIGIAVVLASDPIWPRISTPQEDRPLVGLGIIAVCAAIVIGAAWWIFLGNHVTASFAFSSNVNITTQPAGTVVYGIPWRSTYAEVHLIVSNVSTVKAQNIELKIKADRPIAAVSQRSDIKDVSISPNTNTAYQMMDVDPRTGARKAIPIEFVATEMGYVIRCKELLGRQELKLVVASIGGMSPAHPGIPSGRDYWMEVRETPTGGNEMFRTWFAYPDHSDAVYGPVVAPAMIHITGSYVSAGDDLSIDNSVSIRDLVGEGLSKIPGFQPRP